MRLKWETRWRTADFTWLAPRVAEIKWAQMEWTERVSTKQAASTITEEIENSLLVSLLFNSTVLVKQISSVTCSSSISELWLSLTESRPLDMKMWTYAQRNGRPIVARDSFVYSARSGQSQGFIKRTVNRSPREQFWRHNESSTEKK